LTDCFGALSIRRIDDAVYEIATGEAIAHLRYLERAGWAICQGKQGVGWYKAA